MLNEKQEYKDYVSDNTERLVMRNLHKDLSGYPRALVTIARHFLYAKNGENPIDNIESTIECLKAWSGFEYDESKLNDSAKKEIDKITDWLPEYIKKHTKEATEKQKQKLQLQLKKKRETLEYKMFVNPNNKQNGGGSSRSVTYKSIIADALNMGCLENFFLKVKGDIFSEIEKKSRSNNQTVTSNDKDLIAKITAYYLLTQNRQKGNQQKWMVINQGDVINWSTRGGDLKDWLKKFRYCDTNLFETECIVNNTKKIKINEEWINKFEIKVVDKYEKEDGFIYYEDKGANKPMEEYTGEN